MANKTRTLVLAGSGLWCLVILAGAIFQVPAIYAFFSRICHQDPARAFHIAGTALPVCIRCSSIYLGFFVGVLLRRPLNWRHLELASIATASEFILALFFWDSPWLRAATGLALGATAAPFVVRGIHEMIRGEIRGTV
jgi:hypothetical protein